MLTLPSIPDETLILAITAQDRQAIEILYDRYASNLYRFINRIVKNERHAAALLQEIFLQIWQKPGEFTGISTPGARIYRLARTRALACLRRTKTQVITTTIES